MSDFDIPKDLDFDSEELSWSTKCGTLKFTNSEAVENAIYLGKGSLEEWAEDMEMIEI